MEITVSPKYSIRYHDHGVSGNRIEVEGLPGYARHEWDDYFSSRVIFVACVSGRGAENVPRRIPDKPVIDAILKRISIAFPDVSISDRSMVGMPPSVIQRWEECVLGPQRTASADEIADEIIRRSKRGAILA